MGKNKYRNKKCPCGSGKKFKKCCFFKNEGWVFNELWNSWEKPGMKLPTQSEVEKIAQGILDRSGKPLKATMSDKAEITIEDPEPKTVENEDAKDIALDAQFKEYK